MTLIKYMKIQLLNMILFLSVFLYDTNYDLKLQSTREAEVNAAVESHG